MKTDNLRVWDKKANHFVEINKLVLNKEDPNMGKVTLESGEVKDFPTEVDVMVFASIKDKNEKELFDKDIVSFQLENFTSYAVILRFNNYFTLKSIINNKPIPYGLVKHTIEYVGNLWENPEIFERELITYTGDVNKNDKYVVINDIEIPVRITNFATTELEEGIKFYPFYFKTATESKKDILTPLGYLDEIIKQISDDPITREDIFRRFSLEMGAEKTKELMNSMWDVYNAS